MTKTIFFCLLARIKQILKPAGLQHAILIASYFLKTASNRSETCFIVSVCAKLYPKMEWKHMFISSRKKVIAIYFSSVNPPPKAKSPTRGGGVSFFRKIDLTFLFLEILIFFQSHMKCMAETRRMS